jgi:hypothetical protein
MSYRIRSCLAEPLGALAGIALFLLTSLAAPALAQIGPPVRLLPPPPGTASPVPQQPAVPAPTPAPATDDSIKGTPLAPVDTAWIGTLGEDARPLPQSMWQGTPRSFVAAALPLVGPTDSPELQSLSRRLLLSNAASPQGKDPAEGDGLAVLRLKRLVAFGEIAGALGVLDALPAASNSEALDRLRIELAFAKNEKESGCKQVQDDIARYQGTWWDRALIACQALAGNQAAASLGLSLLREQKAPPDPVFDALINAVGGHPAKIEKLPEPTPILVTLLAAAKMPLPESALPAADPPTLRAWAANDAVAPLQRLAAAERAMALGALAPEELAALYAKVEFKPDELGAAIKQGKAPTSPRDRALLFQVARTDPAAAVRATAMKSLFAEARKRGAFVATARLVAPVLAELPPSDDLAPFAPDVVRALYVAGRGDAATPWLAVIDPPSMPGLPLLTRLVSGRSGDDAALRGALGSLAGRDKKQASLMLALLTSLGLTFSSDDVSPLLDGAHEASLPSAALWMDQLEASTAKRIGETVLTSVILARDGAQLAREPIVLSRVISGLKTAGLEDDARALALEAAIDAGL